MPFRRTFNNTSVHKTPNTYRHSHSSDKGLQMTEGPLFKKILLFSFPLIVTNLLQVLYNAADMVVVGLSPELDAVGAIGTTSAFINLVINVFAGFATGTNVVVARHLGAKDDTKCSRSVHTSLIMSLIFGFLSSIVGLCISRPILSVMGTSGNLLELATTYTKIYFLGVPFISFTNYLIAIFRAKGDTKTPLYILSLSGIINVLLNLFFVLVCGLSVEGVSLATTIANAVSALLLLLKLSKDNGGCRFSFKMLCFDREAFKDILYIGLPAGIQGSLFSLSNMIIQSSILQVNNMYVPYETNFAPVVKGNAAAANLEGFIYTAQNTVYQAAITFTSQNVGAKKYERVYKIMGNCYLLSASIALFMSLLVFFLRTPLLALYGVVDNLSGTLENIAFTTAYTRMCYVFLPYCLISLMEIGCGIVRGLGKSISSTIISLAGACIFRIVWIMTVFKLDPTLDTIYISYPISWALTGIIFFIYAMTVIKKNIRLRDSTVIQD